MGPPITWRNVEAPDFSGASRMMSQAQVGLNSGFNQLQDVLKTEQATSEANWKQVRDNNTQAFLDSINQYRTAEEFQAAQQSGALGQLRSQFGNQIDRAAIRTAEDGRLATLQGRDVQAINYGNTMTDAKEDPIKRSAMAALLSGDKATYNRLVAENPNARFLPEVMDKNRTVAHQNTEWERDGIKFDREGRKLDSDLLTDKARRGLIGAQINHTNAAAAGERAKTSSEAAALKAALAASKAERGAAELLIKNSPLDAGTMDSYEGKMKFLDGLKKLNIPQDQAESAYKEFSSQFGNGVPIGFEDEAKKKPIHIGLPVSTALAAVEAAGGDSSLRPNWLVGSGRGSRAVDQVKKMMGEKHYVESLQAAMAAQGVQYRPLQRASEEDIPSRVGIPKPTDTPEYSGAAVTQQVINARLEKAKSQMTPEELAAARKGRVSPRIQRILEGDDER